MKASVSSCEHAHFETQDSLLQPTDCGRVVGRVVVLGEYPRAIVDVENDDGIHRGQ